MSNTKQIAIEHILEMEGGYVNHPSDPGGETNFGISKRSYPDLDILRLQRWQAFEIYSRDYWDKCMCDKLPAPIAIAVVDYAVNSGVSRSIKALQSTVGTVVDGIIGPRTLATTKEFYRHNGIDTIKWYSLRRLRFLMRLNTFTIFGRNWTNRIMSVLILATMSHAAAVIEKSP